MARARNIKPSLLMNEVLGVADPLLTILFAGLWMLADREGRLEDRPLRIKAQVFPYRELPDFNGYLTELERMGFIHRYSVGELPIIQVINFTKHQSPHKTEKRSELPEAPLKSDSCLLTVVAPLNNETATVKESLIPDSLIPDSLSKTRRFKPPDREQVQRRISEMGYKHVTADAFVNFYGSKNWMVGKNKMADWHQALAGWESRRKAESVGQQESGFNPMGVYKP